MSNLKFILSVNQKIKTNNNQNILGEQFFSVNYQTFSRFASRI